MQQVSTQLRESEFILHLVKPIQIETMQIEMIFAKKYVIHVLSRPDAAKLCRSKCKERVLDAGTESLGIQMLEMPFSTGLFHLNILTTKYF